MTPDELLENEARGWTELSARLDRVGDRWDEPGVNGDWSAKDALAHVAGWHGWAAGILEQRRNGERTEPPTPEWVDAKNAEMYAMYRSKSAEEIRAMAVEARARFRAEISTCDPERSRRLVFGNAEGHYEEHIQQLDSFLGDA